MQKIIMFINASNFILADFTGNRGGVYFETGYAKGLQIPIIYTCEKEAWETDKPHFDVDHYNFIIYEKTKLDELRNKLTDRITITISTRNNGK